MSATFPMPEMVRGLAAVPAHLRGAALAIGNFDGVHPGHQAVLAALTREGERRHLPALALMFEPASGLTPTITPFAETLRLLGALAVQAVVALPGAGPIPGSGTFAERLAASLAPSLVVVTQDDVLTFGWDEQRPSFTVLAIPEPMVFPAPILHALSEGDVAAAANLLGYRWFARGEVIHGDKRGRELGFPTANIALAPSTPLRHGVYAVRVRRAGEILDGVASFGVRPTFGGGAPVLEVFLFDFAGDLYGDTLEVAFVAWIRPELRFDGIAPLVARIREDESEARRILATAGPGSDLDQRLAATNP